VYALVDSQNDSSFIAEDILNWFSLSQQSVKSTTLSLTTMSGESRVKCMKAEGFKVSAVGMDQEVELPVLFSREEIPFQFENVPDPELARAWPHLEPIAEYIQPKDSVLRVGLLIGFDCPQIHFPKSVVAGRPEDPYAVESPVGWYVMG
jgi:hypothetical protein